MTAALAPSRDARPVTVDDGPPEQRFVFRNVDWPFYDRVLRAVGDRRVFVTYREGTLEMMTTSFEHDAYAEMLALLVRTCAQETGTPHKGAGSTTFRRRLADAGLEPDRCFYVQHVTAIRGKRTIDLDRDPPPDLAIEVEISRRLRERVRTYEALGVPELWRCDRRRVRMHRLGDAGRYVEVDRSIAFPVLAPAHVHRFLEMGWDVEEVEWVRAIQSWIRGDRPTTTRRRGKH